MINREKIAKDYKQIQLDIIKGLEIADGKGRFEVELWNREGGGGGRTCILQNGHVIEKGGVNFSAVEGLLPEAVKRSFKVDHSAFFATGVSIVIHPSHPFVPIIHMNIRYFEMPETATQKALQWFGGGIDLTPHYIIDADAQYFHQQLKSVCDHYSTDFYPRFKTWADDYFFIKHRNETRGIGGIFYDRLTYENTGLTLEEIFEFSKAIGRSFVPIYSELILRNINKEYNDKHKQWQYQRRSRYVEFNLVYDSGTKFGLETNGRTESILMSLPPQANWVYNYVAEPHTEEAKTLSLLKKNINWAID